jgi:hypothetical protein
MKTIRIADLFLDGLNLPRDRGKEFFIDDREYKFGK